MVEPDVQPHSYFGGIFVAIANKNSDKMGDEIDED